MEVAEPSPILPPQNFFRQSALSPRLSEVRIYVVRVPRIIALMAALKLMKNPVASHPFYWAGFALVSDGG